MRILLKALAVVVCSLDSNTMSASIKGSHVAIVGGSIAGCATAIALKDAGVAKVTVLERSSSTHLQDRGLGIGLPRPMQELLLNSGYLGEGYKFVQTKERRWFVKDDDDSSWRGPGLESAYTGAAS